MTYYIDANIEQKQPNIVIRDRETSQVIITIGHRRTRNLFEQGILSTKDLSEFNKEKEDSLVDELIMMVCREYLARQMQQQPTLAI